MRKKTPIIPESKVLRLSVEDVGKMITIPPGIEYVVVPRVMPRCAAEVRVKGLSMPRWRPCRNFARPGSRYCATHGRGEEP